MNFDCIQDLLKEKEFDDANRVYCLKIQWDFQEKVKKQFQEPLFDSISSL